MSSPYTPIDSAFLFSQHVPQSHVIPIITNNIVATIFGVSKPPPDSIRFINIALQKKKNALPNLGIDVVDVIWNTIPLWKTKRLYRKTYKFSVDSKPFFSFLLGVTSIPNSQLNAQEGNVQDVNHRLSIGVNISFHLGKNAKLSTIDMIEHPNTIARYFLPIVASIWLPNNNWYIPFQFGAVNRIEFTYKHNSIADKDRYVLQDATWYFHATVLKKIHNNLYGGIGVAVDSYGTPTVFNVPQGTITDFAVYGVDKSQTDGGILFNLLYDNRENKTLPDKNNRYLNIIFRQNIVGIYPKSVISQKRASSFMWNSLIIDVRKYFNVGQSAGKKNILGFWSYNWLVLSGYPNPPYFLLPTIGEDAYRKTGRGYPAACFRGKQMFYLEGEYRFHITRNQLLGGVVFANASYFGQSPNIYDTRIHPAIGTGIRLKFNKFSQTNISIDAAVGLQGNYSFGVTLGEIF